MCAGSMASPGLHGLLHVPGLVVLDVSQGRLGHDQAARVVVVEDVVLADQPDTTQRGRRLYTIVYMHVRMHARMYVYACMLYR